MKRISVSSSGHDQVSFRGFSKDELRQLEGAFSKGSCWVRVDERTGEVVFHDHFTPLPDPVTDREMLPFWRSVAPEEKARAERIIEGHEFEPINGQSPSISISHLCGYGYTPEGYEIEANKLRLWGFHQMRSRREANGRYWEAWYLPGLWAAKGKLEQVIEKADKDFRGKNSDIGDYKIQQKMEKEKLKVALGFLRVNSSFGTLDVCVQRLAMPHPD